MSCRELLNNTHKEHQKDALNVPLMRSAGGFSMPQGKWKEAGELLRQYESLAKIIRPEKELS